MTSGVPTSTAGNPPAWRPQDVQRGDLLLATAADHEVHDVIAASGYEGTRDWTGKKIHDFPVIWIRFTTRGEPTPWPVEALQPATDDAPHA